MENMKLRYLETLAELYPTIAKASTEIINLQAILNLPKGTEHFITDIHGEYEAFSHVLKNGSGSVRRKIEQVFSHTMSQKDKRDLATLIYYPKEKMDLVKKEEPNMEEWYKITLYRLIEVCKRTASKYTRSKVRKALPADFSYVIEELITERPEITDKESYYDNPDYHSDWQSRRVYRGFVRTDSKTGGGPSSYFGGYLRQRPRTSQNYGQTGKISFSGYSMGEP